MKQVNILATIIASFLLLTSSSSASSAEVIDAKANVAVASFVKKYNAKDFLDNLAGYIVFPSVLKGGYIIAGKYGEGVLRAKGESPEYYSVASASVGFQLGVQKVSYLVAFASKDALDNFRKSNGWEAGVDGSITAVNWGVGKELPTFSFEKPIYAFIFDSKGLMLNISLEGTKFNKIQPSKTLLYDDVDNMTN